MSSLNEPSIGTVIDVKSIIDDLKCPICLDYLNVPKTLSCQHSFCHKCLEPLLETGIARCPLCREFISSSAKNLQTNILIDTLIKSLKISSVACPSCNKLKILSACDHCSNVYCHDCKKTHLEDTIEQMSTKLQTLKNHSDKLSILKRDLSMNESHALREMNMKMDELKNRVVQLIDTRKNALFDEIVRFYAQKERALSLVIENSSSLTEKVNELNEKVASLKKDKIAEVNASSLVKSLKSLQSDYDILSDQFDKLTPKIDINSNNLTIQCDKLENLQIYQALIDSVKIKVPANDSTILSKIKAKDRIIRGFHLTVKSVFFVPLQLDFDIDIDEIKADLVRKAIIMKQSLDEKLIEKIRFYDKDGNFLNNEQTEELAKKIASSSSRSATTKNDISNSSEKNTIPDELFFVVGDFKLLFGNN